MTPRPARTPLRAAAVLHVRGLERAADAPGASSEDRPPCGVPRGRGRLRRVSAVAGFAPGQLETFVTGDQLTVSGEGTGDGEAGPCVAAGLPPGAGLGRGLPMAAPAPRNADRAGGSLAIHPATRPGTT